LRWIHFSVNFRAREARVLSFITFEFTIFRRLVFFLIAYCFPFGKKRATLRQINFSPR